MTSTWVYGKAEPGWYVAVWGDVPWYDEHLRTLGYSVVRSVEKPKGRP